MTRDPHLGDGASNRKHRGRNSNRKKSGGHERFEMLELQTVGDTP